MKMCGEVITDKKTNRRYWNARTRSLCQVIREEKMFPTFNRQVISHLIVILRCNLKHRAEFTFYEPD